MAKIVNISEIHLLCVLQNLIFWKNTARVLMRVSLASFILSFRLNVWQKPPACRTGAWDGNRFSPSKDRPYGPEGIHRILRQATGGTSEREHTLPDFLWNYDSPVPSHNQLQDSQCHP